MVTSVQQSARVRVAPVYQQRLQPKPALSLLQTRLDPAVLRRSAQRVGDVGNDAIKGVVGYRAALYGEVGVGNRTAHIRPELRFGGITPNSTVADRSFTQRTAQRGNYSIDQFSANNRAGYFANNTMISSQATWNKGKSLPALEGLRPSQIKFETPRGDGRIIDISRPGPRPGVVIDTEIKAAKSHVPSQLNRDITAASSTRKVEYVFTRNPVTGANGPTPATQTRLNNAGRITNGNLTYRFEPKIAPKPATVAAVQTSSVASKFLRGAGKVAIPLGLAIDTVMIGSAIKADGGKFGSNTKVAVSSAAGGWAGAAGGAAAGVKVGALVGALGGPAGAAVGAVVGGIVGGIAGAIGGSTLGEKLGKLW